MAKVLLMKLVSGEEVIGKEVEEKDNKIVLSDVRVIVAHPGPNGQMAVGMIPWMVGAPESNIEIDKSRIMGIPAGEIPKQLEDGYLQQTSGIAFASANDSGIHV